MVIYIYICRRGVGFMIPTKKSEIIHKTCQSLTYIQDGWLNGMS